MDAETRSRLFEPFFTTKEKGKGTGLGLSMVYGIVKQSGGDIWVYSEQGKGTTFKVYFPLVEENAAEAAGPAAQREAAGGSETILLVEDEAGVRRLVRAILEQRGYAVLETEGPEHALRLCREPSRRIDLRCRASRAESARPGIPSEAVHARRAGFQNPPGARFDRLMWGGFRANFVFIVEISENEDE
jgi:hypothetical protein